MFDLIQIIIGAVVAVVAAFFVGVSRGGAKKEKEIAGEIAKERQRRAEMGRDALQDGRRSGLSPDERLRRNDGDW